MNQEAEAPSVSARLSPSVKREALLNKGSKPAAASCMIDAGLQILGVSQYIALIPIGDVDQDDHVIRAPANESRHIR